MLLRVSEMVCELPALQELDINPLIADEAGAIAVDARVVLRAGAPQRDRYGHMAIHPYPAHLVGAWQPADGPGGDAAPDPARRTPRWSRRSCASSRPRAATSASWTRCAS